MNEKARILVVEDEVAIRTGLIDVLTYHGHEAAYAVEGDEGLRMALGGRFDLVLLDVMLPGMDGFRICQRIREQRPDQAVIMLTAKTDDDDIVRGLSLGADDYVAKPFSVTQLLLRVQAILKRHLSATPAAEDVSEVSFGRFTFNLLRGELRKDGARTTWCRQESEHDGAVTIFAGNGNGAEEPGNHERVCRKSHQRLLIGRS